MGEIKSFWPDKDQVFTGTDLSGAGVTSRGSDPNADGGGDGGSGLKPMWENPPVTLGGQEESGNSVSGLPSLPNRFEPTETPPEMPNLTTRSPGTIDKK